MTDTTTRLLRTWERFPETRPEDLCMDKQWGWMVKTGLPETDADFCVIPDTEDWNEINKAAAHAIAGWRLLELLAAQHGDDAMDQWVDVWCGGITLTLDRVISAVYAAKGETEPSE